MSPGPKAWLPGEAFCPHQKALLTALHWGAPTSVLANPLSTPLAMAENAILSLSYLCASCKTREDPSLLRYHTCDAASSSSLDSEEELWAGWVPPGFCSEPAGGAEFIPLNPSLPPGAELTYPAQLLPKGILSPKKGERSAQLERRNPSPTVT